MESCPEFSLNQTFTLYRDYLELNVTYLPGTTDVLTTYFVGMYNNNGSLIDLFDQNGPHRYVPGYPEDTPITNGIGGWYPSYEMFAPAFDIRDPNSDLGLEWGYNDTEAYVYSPIWMKDMGGGGPSVFALKYSSMNSVVPNIGLGTPQTFQTFIRPYQYSGNDTMGHDPGYAQWVAPLIASYWGHHGTPIFPLTVNDLGEWDPTLLNWVNNSNVTVATYSTNPDQINWNYKSAQLMDPTTSQMPTAWEMLNDSGQVRMDQNGDPIASAADPDYRNYLIYQDSNDTWWWSTKGVFWDEMNVVNGDNQLMNDYQERNDFVYDGYLELVQESYASDKWSYVITNPYTDLLHLAIVSDLSIIEGYEPVRSYNVVPGGQCQFNDGLREQHSPGS